MRYLPDGTQMKAADTETIEHTGIPSLVLMERAALQVVAVMEERGVDTSRALVVCGSGNNGGDGFAVARLLAEKGRKADLLFVGKETSLSGECNVQKRIAENLGIPIFTEFPEKPYSVVIDAVFGVGLCREITGSYRDVIGKMNQMDAYKVAVDIPSGICSATGKVLGTAFRADLTVSMECEKIGCALFPGKEYAGDVVPVPIGIGTGLFDKEEKICFTYEKKDLPELLPERKQNSHKGSFGKVLMVTGSKGMAGAAFLAAKAAYTVGAGLVQIYTHEENRISLQQLLPEAIVSCYETFDEEQLKGLLAWADVVCVGCGLGTGETSRQLLEGVLEHVQTPCVIDADGLNLLSRQPGLLKQIKTPVILTPHMMEMSRLTGLGIKEIAEERMDVLDKFTEYYPVVCVLKDSRTVVSEKERKKFVNLAGNSAMAKAGSGDVLAGVITGFMAQKMPAYESAALGVYVHACGGDEARECMGGYSVLAGDLIRGIGTCMKKAEEMKQK